MGGSDLHGGGGGGESLHGGKSGAWQGELLLGVLGSEARPRQRARKRESWLSNGIIWVIDCPNPGNRKLLTC